MIFWFVRISNVVIESLQCISAKAFKSLLLKTPLCHWKGKCLKFKLCISTSEEYFSTLILSSLPTTDKHFRFNLLRQTEHFNLNEWRSTRVIHTILEAIIWYLISACVYISETSFDTHTYTQTWIISIESSANFPLLTNTDAQISFYWIIHYHIVLQFGCRCSWMNGLSDETPQCTNSCTIYSMMSLK